MYSTYKNARCLKQHVITSLIINLLLVSQNYNELHSCAGVIGEAKLYLKKKLLWKIIKYKYNEHLLYLLLFCLFFSQVVKLEPDIILVKQRYCRGISLGHKSLNFGY
jgi:hypothetical protein